jgi:hypothetical protein
MDMEEVLTRKVSNCGKWGKVVEAHRTCRAHRARQAFCTPHNALAPVAFHGVNGVVGPRNVLAFYTPTGTLIAAPTGTPPCTPTGTLLVDMHCGMHCGATGGR